MPGVLTAVTGAVVNPLIVIPRLVMRRGPTRLWSNPSSRMTHPSPSLVRSTACRSSSSQDVPSSWWQTMGRIRSIPPGSPVVGRIHP